MWVYARTRSECPRVSRSCTLSAPTSSSSFSAASAGVSPIRPARASATILRNCSVVPMRIAILNREGAWSGNASVRPSKTASGSSRRVTRSNAIITAVEAIAISSHRRTAIGQVDTVGSNPDSVHANATDAAKGTTSAKALMARAAHGLPIHSPSPFSADTPALLPDRAKSSADYRRR